MTIPIKAKFDGGGSPIGLGEFETGDVVDISHVPSLVDLGGVTLATLTAHTSNTSNPHSITPAQIGAINTNVLDQPSGVPTLDLAGKLQSSQIPAIAIPSMSVVADAVARVALTVQEGDEAKQLDDGTHWIYDGTSWHQYPSGSSGTPIFGSEYKYEEFEDPDGIVTTSTTNQTALTLLTGAIPSGTYRIGWSFEWNHDSAGNDFKSVIYLLNTVTSLGQDLMVHQQEPKDPAGASGNNSIFGGYTNQSHQLSGFKHIALVDPMSIQVEFASSTNGEQSGIRRIRLEFWRVS